MPELQTASIEPRRSLPEDESGKAEKGDKAQGYDEIVGHRVRPARRIRQILSHPKKQNGGNHRKLAGNDQKCVPQIASLVQRLHLVRGQVALFGGKKEI